VAKRPKRRRKHAADFDRAADDARGNFKVDPRATYEEAAARAKVDVEAYDSATARMRAALNSMGAGLRKGAGIKSKPSAAEAVCARIARDYPADIRAFAAGEPIPGDRLRQMIGRSRVKLDTVRRRLARLYREGTARDPAKLPARGPIARTLDTRNGLIRQKPPSDIDAILPGLRRFR
jgi:hypothetical protein